MVGVLLLLSSGAGAREEVEGAGRRAFASGAGSAGSSGTKRRTYCPVSVNSSFANPPKLLFPPHQFLIPLIEGERGLTD